MSQGMIGDMVDIWEFNKDIDPLTHKLLEGVTKMESKAVKDLADGVGWEWLEQEAQGNYDRPAEGMAKKSIGAAGWFAGMGANNWLSGGQGGVNVGSSLSAAPGPGVVAPGMQKAAIIDSMLINSQSPEAIGLLGGRVGGMSSAQKFALNQGAGLMNPPQQQQPQYRPPPQQQQPMYSGDMYGGQGGMYGQMTEEEKRRLREMGYTNIY